MNIVIVEREQASVARMVMELESKFDIVGVAVDGRSGLEMIERKRPDVILMGIGFGQGEEKEYDGYWLLEELNKSSIVRAMRPKIIVVSELSKEGFVHKAMSRGATAYIVKPYEASELIRAIIGERREESSVHSRAREKGMEESISNIFMSVGIPAHIKGYQYLREAIKLSADNPSMVNSITKVLYPAIASKHHTTSSKVERAIRHAIEVAWNRGRIDSINNYFGVRVYTNKDRPTNGEFIALIADKMALDMR